MGIDIQQGLQDLWRTLVLFVPRLVVFVIILIIGWIVARVLQKVVDTILERVGFDRMVERSGVGRMLARGRYDASSLIARIVYYLILLITLQVAFGVFGPNAISNLLNAVVAWLPLAIVAIIILVIAGAIAGAVKDVITGVLGGTRYGRWLGIAAAVFIWALGIIAALNQVGIATAVTTPVLIAVLATVGAILAIGVGGGLVRPMQQRWERWLGAMEEQAPQMRAQAEAYTRGRQDAAEHTPAAAPGETTGTTTGPSGTDTAGGPGTTRRPGGPRTRP
ncbi:hypothetical protein AB0K60_24045 [Thermopolyspora sp. NPDC052614]|uniref:mechanosensitive ion channel family protein n=1 Tax=Thermopolyspora sp. NPDC052614 TaxID=3155682 RepID=UPI00343774F4